MSLFADDPVIEKYRFSALVSDMDLPAEVVWRTYRGRADCENRIKELKYDFGADSFNMKDFWATEAALNTVMIAYNLMSLFRQVLVKSEVVKKGGISTHSTYSPDPTLQAICQASIPHHRRSKTNIEFSHCHATKAMDAGTLGSRQAV